MVVAISPYFVYIYTWKVCTLQLGNFVAPLSSYRTYDSSTTAPSTTGFCEQILASLQAPYAHLHLLDPEPSGQLPLPELQRSEPETLHPKSCAVKGLGLLGAAPTPQQESYMVCRSDPMGSDVGGLVLLSPILREGGKITFAAAPVHSMKL